ncbi:MAG TPA: trypsin-like peptidase domain-containing protein [Solirubrobacteraceae bacterium]|nr:trypsin-like peptidase domain-containing protein [Solirubrobacteraceae bacterium]
MSRMSRVIPIVGGAVAGGAIALAVASGGGGSSHVTTQTVTQPLSSAAVPTALSTSHGLSINQIYRAASPGVVDITVSTTEGGGGFFGGSGGGQQQATGEGAGVVYDTKGNILTDEHVVDNATSVKVHFQDGRTASAKVLGTDPSTDVAVIHVDVPATELHPVPFADSSTAQVGDPVVAIGSPFSLPETTTAGIVSATGRSITAPNNFTITGAIQTDAAINPGNSGGPLLDGNGHVLGLNDQIQTNSGSNAGVGFAIPSNTVARIANDIIAGHPVKHAYVGVELNSASTGGAQVTQVQPSSPGASAGLQPNDLITAVNGKSVSSTQGFIETVDNYAPGQAVTLTVKRGGQQQTIKLTLGTRPQSASQSQNGG